MDSIQQENSKRWKFWLKIQFVLAAILAGTATYLVIAICCVFGFEQFWRDMGGRSFWSPAVFWLTQLFTAGPILAISTFKSVQLLKGGYVLAKDLGSRKIEADTKRAPEQRICNVVAEIARTADLTVPEIYVMDGEESVNAFTAGSSQEDAVIVVTAGVLQQLSREQMRGLAARQFAQILNGDMQMKTRMAGVLHGLVFWSLIREPLLAPLRLPGIVTSKLAAPIKASFGRQREYLADALAAELTGRSRGLTEALMKVRVLGGRITHSRARQVNHMLCCDYRGKDHAAVWDDSKGSLFRCHPPIHNRIIRLFPEWNGGYPEFLNQQSQAPAAPDPVAAGSFIMLDRLDSEINPISEAQAHILALIWPQPVSEQGLEPVIEAIGPAVAGTAWQLAHNQNRDRRAKLDQLNLLLPSLKEMSFAEFHPLTQAIETLDSQVGQLEMFEFVLRYVLWLRMKAYAEDWQNHRVYIHSIADLAEEATILLSTLAYLRTSEAQMAKRAFSRGVALVEFSGVAAPLSIAAQADCHYPAIEAALNRFEIASQDVRIELAQAMLFVAGADQVITERDWLLLEAMALAIDVDLDPLTKKLRPEPHQTAA